MKILVPLDGGSESESVLPLAGRLAERWQAELTVLHVVDPTIGMLDPLSSSLLESHRLRVLDDGQRYLDGLSQRYPEIPMQRLCHCGHPMASIEEVARNQPCDLVIMATHGHTGWLRWLRGSVAESVARHAPCPTMLVRSAETPVKFREILIPTDGSQSSLSVARRIGRFLAPDTRVTLLHCSGDRLEDSEEAAICDRLSQAVDGRSWMRLEVTAREAPQGIFDWLVDHPCDLIAMSTHGREGLAHFWLGSIMEQVARKSDCPVLAFAPASLSETADS